MLVKLLAKAAKWRLVAKAVAAYRRRNQPPSNTPH